MVDWEQIETATKPPSMKRPDDMFTAAEYATRFGLRVSTARNRLRDLANKGKLISATFLENGRMTTGYKVKG